MGYHQSKIKEKRKNKNMKIKDLVKTLINKSNDVKIDIHCISCKEGDVCGLAVYDVLNGLRKDFINNKVDSGLICENGKCIVIYIK